MSRFVRARLAGIVFLLGAVIACSKDPKWYVESGDKYFAQNKNKEAIVEYRNAVQKDPRFGDARNKLSAAYEKAGDLNNAYREAIRAADLMLDNPTAQVRAANFLIAGRQFEDAKTRADAVLAKDPKNVDALVVRAYALTGLKDLDGAVREIQEAIDLAPNRSSTYESLGQFEQAKGNRQEAETAFKKAIEVSPTSVTPHLALAQYYWSTEQPRETETELKTALELDPKNQSAHRALATFYQANRRSPEAETHLKWLADNSTDVAPKLSLADYYLTSNRKVDAVNILQQISSRKEAFAEAQSRLATVHYSDGDHATAHKVIDGVLRREPKNAKALLVKAEFLTHEQRTDEAIEKLKIAVEADPRSVAAHFTLAGVYASKRDFATAIKEYGEVLRINPKAAAAQLQIARLEIARGSVANSVTAAETALTLQPNNPDAQLLLARSFIASGEVARAEPLLKELTARYPKSAAVEAQRGYLLAAKRDRSGARRAFERTLELDPTSFDGLAGLTALDLAENKAAHAVARVEGRLAQTPKDPALLLLAAGTYFATHDVQKSEDALRTAIEANPSNVQAYSMLAQFYVSQRKTDQALAEYYEVVKRDPRSVGAHTAIGMLLEAQKKTAEAEKRYEDVMQIDPRAPVAANNLAWLYAENGGNLDVALRLAQTAKEVLPDNPQINDTLGFVYYKKQLPLLALDPFKTSVQREPNNPMFQYHLGLTYFALGDRDNARSSLERALKIKPDFQGAEDARQKLDSLKG